MLVKKKLDGDNKLNLQQINVYLDEIKELYQTIYQDFLKSCIFPINTYIEIIETMKTINNNYKNNNEENIKKEYELLSKQLFAFSEKIKKSSYENDIFGKIKKDNDEIISYIQTKDLNVFNDSKNEEISLSINLNELEEENYIKKFSNNSFIKELSLMSHNLSADKSSEILLHDFEKLKEQKEKFEIQFNNTFYNSFEISEMSSFFFKTNINCIKFPTLKNFNEAHSKIDNFDYINYNPIKKIGIPEYSNNTFSGKFESDISFIENEEESDIHDDCEIQLNKFISFNAFMRIDFIFIYAMPLGESTFINSIIGFETICEKINIKILRKYEPQYIKPKKCFEFLNELKIYNLKCTYKHNSKNNSKNKKVLFNYGYNYRISKKIRKYKK